MKKKIAISQSNYIPWKGYFDSIAQVDEFVLYDDMQYTKRDWRNRNKIKTSEGLKWLTIPVEVKGNFLQKIKDTKVADNNWAEKHLKTLEHNYAKSACFKEVIPFITELYVKAGELNTISEINYHFLKSICTFLDIHTKLSFSSDYNFSEEADKSEKLLSICEILQAKEYYTGPAAGSYIDFSLFKRSDIEIKFYDYSGYEKYVQLHGEFKHEVSILDMLFNLGKRTKDYLKCKN